jgi:hypothetical protein
LLHHKLTGSPNSPKLVGPEWKSLYVPRFDASSWCGNNAEISWYDSLKANTTTTESTTGVQLLNFAAFIHDVTFHVARDFRRYQVAQSPVCNDAERVKKTRVTLTDRTGQDTIALRKTQLHCSELNRQFEKKGDPDKSSTRPRTYRAVHRPDMHRLRTVSTSHSTGTWKGYSHTQIDARSNMVNET